MWLPACFKYEPLLLLCLICSASVSAQRVGQGRIGKQDDRLPPKWSVESIGKVGTFIINELHKGINSNLNAVISPVGIWSVLVMLNEAATPQSDTQREIEQALDLRERKSVQFAYERLIKTISFKGDMAEFSNINFLLFAKNTTIKNEYSQVIKNIYLGKMFQMNQSDPYSFANNVNSWAAKTTNNRIGGIVNQEDMKDLLFVLGNGGFFKGKWKYPFNVTDTKLENFKDDFDRVVSQVNMMRQVIVLPYSYSTKLEAQVVEIPYADEIFSMYVILPRQKVRFMDTLSKLNQLKISELLDPENFSLDEIELSLPRFDIKSGWTLNGPLTKMGINAAFSPANAEFSQLAPGVLVSRITHKAEIENNEAGTTASSATVAVLSYKTKTISFNANRPFIYLIVEKKSKVLLFIGTFKN